MARSYVYDANDNSVLCEEDAVKVAGKWYRAGTEPKAPADPPSETPAEAPLPAATLTPGAAPAPSAPAPSATLRPRERGPQ